MMIGFLYFQNEEKKMVFDFILISYNNYFNKFNCYNL